MDFHVFDDFFTSIRNYFTLIFWLGWFGFTLFLFFLLQAASVGAITYLLKNDMLTLETLVSMSCVHILFSKLWLVAEKIENGRKDCKFLVMSYAAFVL